MEKIFCRIIFPFLFHSLHPITLHSLHSDVAVSSPHLSPFSTSSFPHRDAAVFCARLSASQGGALLAQRVRLPQRQDDFSLPSLRAEDDPSPPSDEGEDLRGLSLDPIRMNSLSRAVNTLNVAMESLSEAVESLTRAVESLSGFMDSLHGVVNALEAAVALEGGARIPVEATQDTKHSTLSSMSGCYLGWWQTRAGRTYAILALSLTMAGYLGWQARGCRA